MLVKLFNTLFLIILAGVIFAVASIAGVRNDAKKEKQLAEEQAQAELEAKTPKEVSSPYEKYSGGVLELQMDYEVQIIGGDVIISVVSNLPDSYDLSAEISNVEDVKKKLGFEDISSSALSPEQMNTINEQTYRQKEKNFVRNGVCEFTFKSPPPGQLDLKITSPITKLQPSSVQDLLGEKGVNLQGAYVVFLEEVADKSINFDASFVVEEEASAETPETPETTEK